MANFKVTAKDKNARAGVLKTAHGEVQTPVFMPVGTQGTVKALSPEDLKEAGSQIILGNTYHLYLRPGNELIKKMGGLHKFMNWDGPILTDSGGFQAFSLGAMIEHGVRKVQPASRGSVHKAGPVSSQPRPTSSLVTTSLRAVDGAPRSLSPAVFPHHPLPQPLVSKMTEEGVHFVSHLDGTKHVLTPEKSMEIQLDLGSDIVLVLDELLSPMHSPEYVKNSLERTHRWEIRSKEYFGTHMAKSTNPGAQLFGILQGVYDKEIRQNEAKWIAGPACRQAGFSGVSIGGSCGTSEDWGGTEGEWMETKAIAETMGWVTPLLPPEWPRHALGIGEVVDFFECVERGIDMFDCVSPMRRARNGSLYVSPENGGNVKNKFTFNIAKCEFKEDPRPIDPGCQCYACQNYSRAYLRHLYLAKELLYYRLSTAHNVFYIVNLVKNIRESIINHQFSLLKKKWLE